jgi:hypothetical protein
VASTAVNVPNPVNTPTAIQLAQIADNVAKVIFTSTQLGAQYLDDLDYIADLSTAIRCLAQALITINNTTASSVGTVTTRGAYALGAQAVVPANLNTVAV